MFQARIMAAKERSQQAQTKAAPKKQASADLLMDFDAPATEKDPPPPSYDTNFLQPPPPAAAAQVAMAPPAFDIVENQMNFPPPPPIEAMDAFAPPPRMMGAYESPPASAPAFEDLLDSQHNQQTHNPLAGMQAVPPPAAPPAIDEDILGALDPAEREALLEEQQKIMAQIEKEKASNTGSAAAARAMAFDQRSSNAVAQVAGALEAAPRRSAPTRPATSSSRTNHGGQTVDLGAGEEVPLHGQERTQQAIKDGTALVVQCVSCQNWMQVTESASLMFCPVCQTVTSVDKAGAATSADMEAAAQLAADAELAERLQNEEYGGVAAEPRTRRPKAAKPQEPKAGEEGQSWYNWLTGTPEEKAKAAAPSTPTHGSAEIRRSPALVLAHTGAEEGAARHRSYDESEGLLGAGGGGGARVAEQKSMFSCVADSISTAATQMTAYNVGTDEEGNVHGVDSSSLLAMPDVSRQPET
jgi:LSD1 subclass zinc finger protein